jgi:hypothetical protein
MAASALGLLISISVGLAVVAPIYDLTLNDILKGVKKLSIGLAIVYIIMIPLVYFEQIKKTEKINAK